MDVIFSAATSKRYKLIRELVAHTEHRLLLNATAAVDLGAVRNRCSLDRPSPALQAC